MILKKNQGYTLAELMVVGGIIAILAVFAVPAFKTWARNWELRGEVRALASNMQLARLEAVKRKATAGIVFVTTANGLTMGGSYQIYVDNNRNGMWDAGEEISGKSVARSVALYGSTWGAGVRFDTQGLANGSGSVRLANRSPLYYKISVSNSGNIRVEKSGDEGAI